MRPKGERGMNMLRLNDPKIKKVNIALIGVYCCKKCHIFIQRVILTIKCKSCGDRLFEINECHVDAKPTLKRKAKAKAKVKNATKKLT